MKTKLTKRILALLLTLVMVFSLLPTAFADENHHPFTDVPDGKWYSEAVQYVYDNGLMIGTSATTFNPGGTLTRAMLVTILYRAAGEPTVEFTQRFTDVPAGRYYSDPVAWAVENHITDGVSATRFNPNGSVTREQLAKFLFSFARLMCYAISARDDLSAFPDTADAHDWAVEPLQWAVGAGIINGVLVGAGDTAEIQLQPRASATRAQVAAMLMRFFQSNLGPDLGEDAVILYTNDVHTYIDKALSYDTISGLKKNIARTNDVILVDAGDHIQGTAFGSMDKGKTILDLMNAANYDLATLGNHEFDYTMEGCMNAIEWANFPYVSCNFYHEENGVRGENVLDAYKVFELGGKKVALIGITTPESFTKSTPAYFQDENGNYIYGISGGEDGSALYADVQAAIDAAKAEADVVIALGHLGIDPSSSPWTSKELIANTTGLDAFIDGHSHSTVAEELVKDKAGNDVVLTQTGCYFGAIGMMRIAPDGTISTELITECGYSDPAVKEIEDEWINEINDKLGEVIGHTALTFDNYDETGRLVRKMETNTGDFTADALYYLFDNLDYDVDVAFMNGGGVRNRAITGDISYLTCKNIHTFGNVACLQTVTGQQILDALEWGSRSTDAAECGGFLQVSGLKYKVDPTVPDTTQKDDKGVWTGGPTGEYRVYDVEIFQDGEWVDLDLDAEYNLAGYNYTLRDLGDGFAMFDGAVNVIDYVMEDYMVLANYVKAFPIPDGATLPEIEAANSPLVEKFGADYLDYTNVAPGLRIQIAKKEASEDSGEDLYVLTNELQDGDQVVIYHPASGMALSNADLSETQTGYRAGLAVTPEDDVIKNPDAAIVWTAEATENGWYLKDEEGRKLSIPSGSRGLVLDGADPEWALSAAEVENCVNLKSTTRTGNSGDPLAIEWYSKFSEFTVYYANAGSADFALQLYVKTEQTEPGDLTGKTVILHTNDTHGALLGFAQVAAVKAEYEAKGANVILVDAGDYSQGTTYVSTSKGASAVTMLNAAGYDFATLGNHEFDFGYAQLVSNMEQAEFQLLCADVLLKETGESAFTPYAIHEVDGVKIGFFGMETPETFTKVNPGLIQEITFPQGEAMYACAQAQVDALKAEGADLIIGLVHLGVDDESEPNRSIDLYNHVTGIDFLIDGHSHTVMTEGPNGEPIQSTGTKAGKTALMNVGMIQIDDATKTIEKNELIALGEEAPTDETVAAIAQAIMDEVDAQYGAVFAQSEVELNGDKAPGNRNMETNLGDLITDSMLWTVLKAGELDVPDANVVAITNGGGIRAWIHQGDVTMNDVNTVLPFGNTIAVVYVKGAELLEALEASTYSTPGAIGGFPQVAGMKFTIDTTKEYDKGEQYPESTYYGPASIQRVTINEVGGNAFDPDATYAVVTNNFCAAGGDTYHAFKAASAQFDTSIPMDEALMEYITDELGAVIGEQYAEPQGRITIIESTEPEDIIIGGLDANVWTTKYGNIYTSCTAERLQEMGFAYGDIITVKFLDKSLDLPLVPTFSYVDQGTPALFINKSETGGFDGYLFMAINMGDFTTTYGIATKTTNPDKTWYWTACEGVTFPIVVTLEMKEQGGYATEMAIRDITRTNNREDYPELTDAEFANFRQITTTGMGDHLYRGSSPINPEIGRNTYADAALEAAGATVIMNLANDQATAEGYEGFSDTYYSKQNVVYLNLGVDFTAADFQSGLATGLRHFAENEGVYYVHCTEGKDRAGFVSALLECLMGATYDEVVADYLKTYTNYYTVVDGVQQPLSQETLDAIANSNIIKTLQTAFEVEDLTTADLAAEAAEYVKVIGLTDEELAALKENLGDSRKLKLVEDANDMLKYGHLVIDVSTEDLLKEFAYGDIVTVTVEGYGAVDAPICSNYDDVDTGETLIRAKSGKTNVNLAINYGQIGVQLGIIETAPDGSATQYQVKEGVTFPIYVTIEMKEAGGYADELAIRAMTRDDNHDNRAAAYPDLTDAEYANFRVVTTTGMGEDALYRSSSPINPEIGRNAEADAAAQAAGIKAFMNMADTQAEAEAYAGYADTYYAGQNKIFLGLPVAFTTDEFKTGLADGYRFIASNDGPYLIHCTEGKDRTGLGVAVLEALMGASIEEIKTDYLQTYINYYNVVDGVQQPLTDAQKAAVTNTIVNNLGIIFDADVSTASLADEAEAYLTEIGLTADEQAALKVNLGKSWSSTEPETPTASYEVAESVSAGDQIVMVYTVGDKFYAMTNDNSTASMLKVSEVTFTDGVLDTPDASTVFTLETGSADGSFLLKGADGKYIFRASGTAVNMQETGADWTLTLGEGASRIAFATDATRCLFIRDNDPLQIRCYSTQNLTASGYYSTATIYKVVNP